MVVWPNTFGLMEKKYNLKSPAVKRLMREAVELKDPTYQYHAQPLEDNLFEWHFTVRGPPDTEFAGGRYHGRITLPAEYPMKPPSIILLTPNGRFELGKKICLSMSAHHPETWQPSWSLRTVMLALIGFMPTKGAGAIGALDYPPEERKKLATKSNEWSCDSCGFDHQTCLLEVPDADSGNSEDKEAKELASQINFKGEAEKQKSDDSSPNSSTATTPTDSPQVETVPTPMGDPPQDTQSDTVLRRRAPPASAQGASTGQTSSRVAQQESRTNNNNNNENLSDSVADYVSLILLWIVAIALVILIVRRLSLEGNTLSKV